MRDTTKMWEAYNKIKKVIDSCETSSHMNVADRMIDLFKERFDDDQLSRDLDVEYLCKLQEI